MRLQRQLLEAEGAVRDSTHLLRARDQAKMEPLIPTPVELSGSPIAGPVLRAMRPAEGLATGSSDWRIAAMEHLAKHAAQATEGALKATTGTYAEKRRRERLTAEDLSKLEAEYANRDAELSSVRGTKNFFSISPGLRVAPSYPPVD